LDIIGSLVFLSRSIDIRVGECYLVISCFPFSFPVRDVFCGKRDLLFDVTRFTAQSLRLAPEGVPPRFCSISRCRR
jgi:hypothetical protein